MFIFVKPVTQFNKNIFKHIFGANFRILDISSGQHIQFFTRNLIFMSNMPNFESQKGNLRKNEMLLKPICLFCFVCYIFIFQIRSYSKLVSNCPGSFLIVPAVVIRGPGSGLGGPGGCFLAPVAVVACHYFCQS